MITVDAVLGCTGRVAFLSFSLSLYFSSLASATCLVSGRIYTFETETGSDTSPSATSRVDGRLPLFFSSEVIVMGSSLLIELRFLIGVPTAIYASSLSVIRVEAACCSLLIAVMNLGGCGLDVELPVEELSPRLCLDCFWAERLLLPLKGS